MGKQPVRILETKDGTEVIGRKRRIRLKTAGYEQLVRLFTNPHPSPAEAQRLMDLRHKLNGEEEMSIEADAYELGDRVILSAGVCPRCLGLQYPVASRFRFQLPAFMSARKYTGNKLVKLDACGLQSIQSLPEVAHAECCPLHCSPLEHLEDRAVDEGVLSQELVSAVVKNIKFRFDRYWILDAEACGRVVSFAGPSKRRVLEDLYAYLLEQCYSYRQLSPGLTDQAAYLHYLNRQEAGDTEELEQGDWTSGRLAFLPGTEQPLPSQIRYKRLQALMIVYLMEAKYEGKLYRAIGESLEDAVFRVWNQIRREDCDPAWPYPSPSPETAGGALCRYEDGLSRKFGFSLLGGDRR